MKQVGAMEVSFTYDGQAVRLRSVSDDDHILNNMRRRKTFYESDVLESLKDRLSRRPRCAAIDAGAFIGTHSVYLAKFCRMNPVIAFEANPVTFAVLKQNLALNNLCEVVPISKALGELAGVASSVPSSDSSNQGAATVQFADANASEPIPVTTIDDELRDATVSIGLLKIDVEGAELSVLRGAKKTIRIHRPILCIEVHSAGHLHGVLSELGDCGAYTIVDCLGYSPTYIIEPTQHGALRRFVVNAAWICRAALPPKGSFQMLRWYLLRFAKVAAG